MLTPRELLAVVSAIDHLPTAVATLFRLTGVPESVAASAFGRSTARAVWRAWAGFGRRPIDLRLSRILGNLPARRRFPR